MSASTGEPDFINPVRTWNRGRLFVSWWPLRAWGLGYHGAPCCAFWLELGPLEIMVVPARDTESEEKR